MQTVDITPTWSGVVRLLVELATRGTTPQARETAWRELERMAKIADDAVELSKRV